MNMREKMARALFAVMHPADDPDERWTAIRDGVRVPLGPAPWEQCLPEADAALSALAEPTEAMLDAGDELLAGGDAWAIFCAMIDAAKST